MNPPLTGISDSHVSAIYHFGCHLLFQVSVSNSIVYENILLGLYQMHQQFDFLCIINHSFFGKCYLKMNIFMAYQKEIF